MIKVFKKIGFWLVNKWLLHLDKNKDGKISIEEIEQEYKELKELLDKIKKLLKLVKKK